MIGQMRNDQVLEQDYRERVNYYLAHERDRLAAWLLTQDPCYLGVAEGAAADLEMLEAEASDRIASLTAALKSLLRSYRRSGRCWFVFRRSEGLQESQAALWSMYAANVVPYSADLTELLLVAQLAERRRVVVVSVPEGSWDDAPDIKGEEA